MDGNHALIQLDGVRFGYPGRPALFDDLNLVVRDGDRLGVVGANGSGKTTLFHLVVGLQRPISGHVRAFGCEVVRRADYDAVRRRVGFLFQDSDNQLFSPTVRDDVAFGPLNLGKSSEDAARIVAETLERLGLADYADRISYDLSGGEKRLVALATVLAMDPEVLLLDEPANGLDPRARAHLVELLARIDGTQVISSHDMEFVRATCRRVVVLDTGVLVAQGPTDEILGDANLMLRHGLEVPYSLGLHEKPGYDHHHGAGTSHGHGHSTEHDARQHAALPRDTMS
ncbi:MAG: energy-coupling factor ABC transporter ATP-binding protein [Verrucomicrobia bacterium]|nr:energy-coupling factor ABC transporter ATP-binding protein [Verrucomicrobiota bacterium]